MAYSENTKTYENAFSKERKKERKKERQKEKLISIVSGETADQNNDEQEEVLKGVSQVQANCFMGKKSNFEKWKIWI